MIRARSIGMFLMLIAVTGCINLPRPTYFNDPLVAELGKKYSLHVNLDPAFPVKTRYGEISGKAADRTSLESYSRILNVEWNLYPPELVAKTKLKRIILCKELSFGGQTRTAIPDFENDDIYFDVCRGRHSEAYTRKVIHHEFFHVVDWRDDGILYADERWASLNSKSFKYGAGGKHAQNDSTAAVITDAYPGFLNRYSMSGVEEDKAELFAHMVVEAKVVRERAKKDLVLNAKMERLRELIHAFVPKEDAQFWKAVEELKRNADGKPTEPVQK